MPQPLRRLGAEPEFRAEFDASGRSYRSELWLIMLVLIGLLLLFHSYLLGVPSELIPLGPYFVVGVVVPMILRWLSGAQSPIQRWSAPLFVAAVYIDIAALMAARIVCIRHGLDVVPIIVPVAVLASLLMVQIRFAVLAPAVVVGFVGMAAAELSLLPIDSNRLFGLAASAGILLVPLASARELERVAHKTWLRRRRLADITRTDALTGLPNRLALRQAFAALSAEGASPLTAAIIDIDRFKKINDRYGHAVGDECLRAIGHTLAERNDPGHEFAARLSGEEFVVLWHGTDPAQAHRRVEEIRAEIELLGLPAGYVPGDDRLTVSAGVAVLGESEADADSAWAALLRAADEALYVAKRGGRNQIGTAPQAVRAEDAASVTVRTEDAAPLEPTGGADRLRSTFWSLRLPGSLEHAFRASFDEQGLAVRRVIMAGVLVVCALIFVFQGPVLQIPDDAALFGRLCLALGIMPASAVALAAAFSERLRPWSAHVYIAGVAVIIAVQMVQRVIQLPKGYDVVPWLMPVTVLLSMSVVQIRYSLLLPATGVLLTAMAVTEFAAFPLTGNQMLSVVTAAVMAAVTLRFAYRVEQTRRVDWLRAEQLEQMSRVDPMTGLPNRRQFVDDLESAVGAAETSDAVAALLLVDMDQLKAYNDRYGHLAGDACIRRVGQVLAQQCPPGLGSVARLGGEEFALVLRDSSPQRIGDRARQAVAQVAALEIPASTPGGVVTVSAGLVPIGAADDTGTLLRRADDALYRAKRAGRNRLAIGAVTAPISSAETPAPTDIPSRAGQ